MIVLTLERVTPGLRGELTKWLLEITPGVFVGSVSPMVRDQLWQVVVTRLRDRSGAMLVTTASSDQGLRFRIAGTPDRDVVDLEGLFLVRRRAVRPPPEFVSRSEKSVSAPHVRG